MQQTAQEVIAYLQGNPVLYLGIAFVAGFAACKTVASDSKRNLFLFLVVGLLGLFLSQLVFSFALKAYIEKFPEFRPLFDLLAAYVGSFFLAAIIHFIKPV